MFVPICTEYLTLFGTYYNMFLYVLRKCGKKDDGHNQLENVTAYREKGEGRTERCQSAVFSQFYRRRHLSDFTVTME